MKKIYTLIFSLSLSVGLLAQSIFDNPITGTNPNADNPYIIGQTVNPNITVSGIGRGAGINGVNTNDRYNASSWNTPAIDLTAYFEFILTPNVGQKINFVSFVYAGQASGTGPTSFAFRSSLDGYVADIGTPTATGATIDLTGGTYQNISSVITFRIYGWNAGGATGTFSVNDFTFNGVTSVLPITIEYLTGVKQNNSNLLAWKVNCTSSSTINMAIEQSTNAKDFKEVSSIAATYLRCLQPFDYAVSNPASGVNYYRLKTTDENAKISYSKTIVIINKESGFDIAGLLPSVVNTTAILNTGAAKKMQMNVIVTDFAGKKVQQQIYNLVAGSNQIEMNFSNLAAGAYQLTAYTNDGDIKTVRFVKQ